VPSEAQNLSSAKLQSQEKPYKTGIIHEISLKQMTPAFVGFLCSPEAP